ncbi:hypothetical protein QE152_g27661 [Popillia japonica]|uniref:Uncharacterized protein n=1 Tax=Popillia japonica TaxID=7064 RepID=A0AAW1JUX3_POPJA
MIYVVKQNKELRRYLDSVATKLDGIVWNQLPALEVREKDLKSNVNRHEKEISNLLLLENKINAHVQSLEGKIRGGERQLKLKLDILERALNSIHLDSFINKLDEIEQRVQIQLTDHRKRIDDLEKK